jgi:rubrerythrin
LILVLSNKETQICLDLAKHTEERYIDNASNEQTRMRACKLAYVLYRWVKSKLPSSDDQLTHVTARITQLTQQINQHHADREVNSFLAKKRAPSTREASSLTRLRNFLEPAQQANIDKVLQSVKQATALQCPFCQAQVTGDDHCLRNPTHPLQFCALTMILIDTTQTLKCATCHQETLILRNEKENNFDWITEPDLCPTCNSLLANNMAI